MFTPKTLHNRCFQLFLGITVVLRDIQDTGYVKFWPGVNKVHYGLCENGEFDKNTYQKLQTS